jgi:hypothetical protein
VVAANNAVLSKLQLLNIACNTIALARVDEAAMKPQKYVPPKGGRRCSRPPPLSLLFYLPPPPVVYVSQGKEHAANDVVRNIYVKRMKRQI